MHFNVFFLNSALIQKILKSTVPVVMKHILYVRFFIQHSMAVTALLSCTY